MKVSILFIYLIMISSMIISQEFSISGDVESNFFYIEGLEDDCITGLTGSVFFNYYTIDNFSIVADLESEGSLSSDSSTDIMNIVVKQLYMNFFIEDFICYIGKKSKRIGSAEWFNISNRITPTFLDQGSRNNSSIGMVDIEYMFTNHINIDLITYFPDTKINIASSVTMSFLYLDLDLNYYFEEMENHYTAINLSSQLDRFNIYCEGSINEDYDIKLSLGTTYGGDTINITTEVLYGEENYYGGFSFTKSNLFIDNLTFNFSTLHSISDNTEEFWDLYSVDGAVSISYMYKDLLFTGYFNRSFGGDESEYILQNEVDFTLGLITSIYF